MLNLTSATFSVDAFNFSRGRNLSDVKVRGICYLTPEARITAAAVLCLSFLIGIFANSTFLVASCRLRYIRSGYLYSLFVNVALADFVTSFATTPIFLFLLVYTMPIFPVLFARVLSVACNVAQLTAIFSVAGVAVVRASKLWSGKSRLSGFFSKGVFLIPWVLSIVVSVMVYVFETPIDLEAAEVNHTTSAVLYAFLDIFQQNPKFVALVPYVGLYRSRSCGFYEMPTLATAVTMAVFLTCACYVFIARNVILYFCDKKIPEGQTRSSGSNHIRLSRHAQPSPRCWSSRHPRECQALLFCFASGVHLLTFYAPLGICMFVDRLFFGICSDAKLVLASLWHLGSSLNGLILCHSNVEINFMLRVTIEDFLVCSSLCNASERISTRAGKAKGRRDGSIKRCPAIIKPGSPQPCRGLMPARLHPRTNFPPPSVASEPRLSSPSLSQRDISAESRPSERLKGAAQIRSQKNTFESHPTTSVESIVDIRSSSNPPPRLTYAFPQVDNRLMSLTGIARPLTAPRDEANWQEMTPSRWCNMNVEMITFPLRRYSGTSNISSNPNEVLKWHRSTSSSPSTKNDNAIHTQGRSGNFE